MSQRPVHHLRRLSALFVGLSAMVGTVTVTLGISPASAIPCPSTTVGSSPALISALSPGTCATIFVAQGTYTGPFVVARSVNIVGAAESTTILNGGDPVVKVTAGTVTIENLTITGGTDGSDLGAGIQNYGSLTLMNVSVSGNTSIAGDGAAGIYNGDKMTVDNGFVSRNSSIGSGSVAGIYNADMMTIQNSTISQNLGADTGGIYNDGTLDVYQSTINNNSGHFGAGIYNEDTLYLSGVSISGNNAVDDGGGIYNPSGATATILGGLIANNTAFDGGGIWNEYLLTMNGSGGVDYNYASDDGGAIYQENGSTFLSGTTIRGNIAGVHDPAIHTNSGSVNLSGVNETDNRTA